MDATSLLVAVIVGLLLFVLYREWRQDRERSAWTRERAALIDAAAGTKLGLAPQGRRRPRGETAWAERAKESRGHGIPPQEQPLSPLVEQARRSGLGMPQ